MPSSKRKTIGFCISSIHGDYAKVILNHAANWCQNNNCNLLIFASRYTVPTIQQQTHIFDEAVIQSDYMFKFLPSFDLHAIIVAAGTMLNYMELEHYEKYLSIFKNLPIYQLGEGTQKFPMVIIDQCQGLRDAIEHLVVEHKIKTPLIISGAKTHPEARQRLSTTIEVLEKHGLTIPLERIFFGPFTMETGEEAANYFLDKMNFDFDSIICSTDDIAMAFMEQARRRNYKVMDNFAVMGFDNSQVAYETQPPLSTVHQPLREQVDACFEMAANGIMENIILPSIFIQRNSCGCTKYGESNFSVDQLSFDLVQKIEEISQILVIHPLDRNKLEINTNHLKQLINNKNTDFSEFVHLDLCIDSLLENTNNIARDIEDIRFIYSLFRSIKDNILSAKLGIKSQTVHYFKMRETTIQHFFWTISVTLDQNLLVGLLNSYLPVLGINELYMVIYPERLSTKGNWQIPSDGYLVCGFKKTKDKLNISPQIIIKNDSFIKDLYNYQAESSKYVFSTLFYGDFQLGYIISDFGDFTPELINPLTSFFSTAIYNEQVSNEISLLNQSLQKMKENLEIQVYDRTRELSKTNEDLLSARNEAEESSKAKSQFLTTMSHEIRTPMNAIFGYAEILEKEKNFDNIQNISQIILQESTHLLQLINQLLDLGKIESGKLELDKENFQLKSLLDELKPVFEAQLLGKPVQFILEYDKDIPDFLGGDRGRLRQILINLVGNSVKFTHKGHIKIKVKILEKTYSFLNIQFTVEDTGPGIPKSFLPIIFNRFTQAKNLPNQKQMGTGLGTAIARQLVELMGGKIEVQSEEKVGTSFIFNTIFEIEHENFEPIQEFRTSDQVFPEVLFGAKILLAEDYPANRDIVLKFLSNLGCKISHVENGKLALDALAKEEFDLVLMDVFMPIMNGLEASRAIHNNHKIHRPKILGLTANAFEADLLACLNAGMDDILTKPVRKNTLIEKISLLLPWPLSSKHLLEEFGSENELRVFYKEFLEESDRSVESMEADLKNENWENLHREAHSAKGAALNLSAPRLFRASKLLEIHAKEKNKLKAQISLINFKNVLLELKKFLNVKT